MTIIRNLFWLLLILMTAALFDFALAGFFAGGVSAASATGLLVNLMNKDPQIWQQWQSVAFRAGEAKTEFTESEIGTSFADDGPKPAQQVKAAPILYQQHHTKGGRQLNIRYHEPVMEDTQEILNAGRVNDQDRIGYEYEMSRRNVVAIVDKNHFAIREEDVEQGEQFTANLTANQVMGMFVRELSDQNARRTDLETFYAFFSGYAKNTHISSSARAGLSNSDVPVADTDTGHQMPMTEHPETYAWIKENDAFKLEPVTFHATQATHSQNFVATLSKVTDDATPGLKMLRAIRRKIRQKNMIPNNIRLEDGKSFGYFLVYVSDRIKNLIESDDKAFELYVKAYQGMVQKNPLLQEGDMFYKNMIIRESKRLDEEFFSCKTSFNATGHGSGATDASFNITGSSIKDGTVSITEGAYSFAADTPGRTALGENNTQLVGRIMVLGANALLKLAGKKFDLKPMEITQYGLNNGIAQTRYFGCQRVQNYTASASGLAFNAVPQSMQILCFQGD